MGIVNHNAIIATTSNISEVKRISYWIASFDNPRHQRLFIFSSAVTNGYITIFLMPDGSKEGWPENNDGDILRNKFIEELKKADYSDGSSPWYWIEVGYGEYGQKILQGNCKNRYNNKKYAI